MQHNKLLRCSSAYVYTYVCIYICEHCLADHMVFHYRQDEKPKTLGP